MSLVRYALPALAAAGTAYAACSASATTTIQNGGDAAAFTSCKTFSGSIAVETGAGDIELNGIQVLDGNLVVTNNSQINALSGDSMEEIRGKLELGDLQALNNINFPKLKKVESIDWRGLARLDVLGFDAEITEADEVHIENTFLSSLNGINLATVKKFTLASNNEINDVIMENLGNVSDSFVISDNNRGVNVSLPNLIWASNLTFRAAASVELPSLEKLNGSLGLYNNAFTSFKAPNLTEIGGALALVSNEEMTNLTFPELTIVKQNLQVANNTKLNKINGFPKLETIGGALDFNGNMSTVELPSIDKIFGAFNLQSTGQLQETCDDTFEPLKKKDRIKGKFLCKGSVANPGGEGTTPTVTGANADKTGAASVVQLGQNAMLAGLAAAFFL